MSAEAMETECRKVIEKTRQDPRFKRGQTLLKENRHEEAIAAFEDLLKTMVEAEKQSDTLATAPVYYEYGHAMLSLAEATASVFGAAVAEEKEEGGEEGGNTAKENADDLEVAWEMLEVARVIYTRHEDDLAVERELARVYMRLGDLGMESEMFEQARRDYEKSLLLRSKVLRATADPDTTLLADLYCCLAISCIYQDSAKSKEGSDDASNAANMASAVNLEEKGMEYYVKAGHVMAENIHRVAKECAEHVQKFVSDRIPAYSHSQGLDASVSGKRKANGACSGLDFKGPGMASIKEDFSACVQEDKAVNGESKSSTETNTEDKSSMTAQEAQLLEYLDIYVELKEKVDGIKEGLKSHSATQAATSNPASSSDGPVTTIGFGTAPAKSAAGEDNINGSSGTVNVLSAVKKRKVTSQSSATAQSKA